MNHSREGTRRENGFTRRTFSLFRVSLLALSFSVILWGGALAPTAHAFSVPLLGCLWNCDTSNSPTTPTNPTAPTTPTNPSAGTQLENPLGSATLSGFITTVLVGLGQVGYVLVVLALVYTGFLFIAAQGKEEKIREARQALLYTVIGGVILLGATALYALIQGTVAALSAGS